MRNRTPYRRQAGCSRCGEKDLAQFYATSAWCKKCHKDAVYRGRLRKIGMTLDELAALRQAQGNRCAVCGAHADLFRRALHMDHNHDTNQPRGLLCQRCNQTLGRVGDDAELLRKLADYLDRTG